MENVNLQVKLSGKYADAFRLFKERPKMQGKTTNTVTIMEIIQTLPEWKVVNKRGRE